MRSRQDRLTLTRKLPSSEAEDGQVPELRPPQEPSKPHRNLTTTDSKANGIVPYVDPPSTGSISGIVGAGGNAGAVGFGM
jgi:hypothetical protein